MQGSQAIVLFVSFFIVCASAATAYTASEYQSFFTAWQQEHKKSYQAVDFLKRFANFKQCLDFIKAHNDGSHSFTLGLNEFSDLTLEEYRSMLLYPIYPVPTALGLRQHSEEEHAKRAVPSSIDWRTSGAVQAIKNQGSCGSCWTFATAASIESLTFIKTGTLPNLSEQNLLDCVSQGNSGCGGGVPYYAQTYVINNKGIDTAASYPYTGARGNCRYNPANSGASITGVTQIPSGSESALQSAVAMQPVSIAIDASLATFKNYKTGTYKDSACSTTNLNHAVLAVGYGSDSSGDYWIVKNSWGLWGDKGYVKMARNAGNACGIATNALYPRK